MYSFYARVREASGIMYALMSTHPALRDRIRSMTVIYPSWIECLIFAFLGVICGLIVKFIYLIILDAVRSVLSAVRERRRKGEVHAEGAGWDETVSAFKRSDDTLS